MWPKGTEEGAVGRCCICGREDASFELPGTTEKFCSGCSADFATIVVLTAEIDSAKLKTEFARMNCDRSCAPSAGECWSDRNLRN